MPRTQRLIEICLALDDAHAPPVITAADLAILLCAQAHAGEPLEWFEPRGSARATLEGFRALACGEVDAGALPWRPAGQIRLVYIACDGEAVVCPGRLGSAPTNGLACPPDVSVEIVATAHLVSDRPMAEQLADVAARLGPGFARLDAADGRVVFQERAGQAEEAPRWSPKRLHVTVSQTKDPFANAGYLSQLTFRLSLRPPNVHGIVGSCIGRYRDRRRIGPRDGFARFFECDLYRGNRDRRR